MNTALARLAAQEVGQLVTGLSRTSSRRRSPKPANGPHISFELSSVEDGTKAKLAELSMRKPGDPHPFVIGNTTIQRYPTTVRECAQVGLATSR